MKENTRMPELETTPDDDPGWEAYYRLRAYVTQVQDDACILAALIEGMVILKDNENGANALTAVMDIAEAKASGIYMALDSVNLPQLDPAPASG
jgi:hypothetical protein